MKEKWRGKKRKSRSRGRKHWTEKRKEKQRGKERREECKISQLRLVNEFNFGTSMRECVNGIAQKKDVQNREHACPKS